MTGDQVAALLRARRFNYHNEDSLQEGLHAAIEAAGEEADREVPLGEYGRIDVVVGRVGIEAKVTGGQRDVIAQVTRYASCPDLDEIVLVTNRVRHRIPAKINGKRVHVVNLVAARL